jgi:hypothetical protein
MGGTAEQRWFIDPFRPTKAAAEHGAMYALNVWFIPFLDSYAVAKKNRMDTYYFVPHASQHSSKVSRA